MARVVFTRNLERYVACPPREVAARSVREALEGAFADNPALRGYVLDEQGRLRRHLVIFINGVPVADRSGLSDEVDDAAEVFVLQALSGG